MSFIDTHCHLDLEDFREDLNTVVQNSIKNGVQGFIIAGVAAAGWDKLLQVCRHYRNCYAAPGLHPCYLSRHSREDLKRLDNILCRTPDKIVAVGETGLDCFIPEADLAKQTFYCQEQIRLAQSYQLPLLLHVRKAHDQMAKLLKQNRFTAGGVVHCYSGSLQQAQRYLDLGFKLGIGGVITYERSRRLQKIVSSLPLNSFVLETDAPDIPIFNSSRNRNSPEYLPDIFKAFCQFRAEPPTIVQQQLLENTWQLFPPMR